MDFWRCICISHDVSQVFLKDSKGGKVETYQGASLDEVAFLEMCKAVGFVKFNERDSDYITISVQGKIEKYRLLRVVEFTSERKRMSVMVKNEATGRVVNFIKGADFEILPRLA